MRGVYHDYAFVSRYTGLIWLSFSIIEGTYLMRILTVSVELPLQIFPETYSLLPGDTSGGRIPIYTVRYYTFTENEVSKWKVFCHL